MCIAPATLGPTTWLPENHQDRLGRLAGLPERLKAEAAAMARIDSPYVAHAWDYVTPCGNQLPGHGITWKVRTS